MKYILSLSLLLLVFGFCAVCEARIWTSTAGTNIDATLLNVSGDSVRLRTSNGRELTVKLDQLSEEDRVFIEKISARKIVQTDQAGTEVEAISLKITRKPSREPKVRNFVENQDGTSLTLLISPKDVSIISFDREKSKITEFTDDSDTDLLKSTSTNLQGGKPPISTPVFALDDIDHKRIEVEFNAPSHPEYGARKIKLKGVVCLVCGSETEVSEFKNVPLDGKGGFELDGIHFTLKMSDESSMFGDGISGGGSIPIVIQWSTKKPMDFIKDITFFDADGKKIESHRSGAMRIGDSCASNYELKAKDLKNVSVKLEVFKSTNDLLVPIDIETGLGF